MKIAIALQIIARSFLLIFIFATDSIAIDILNVLPKSILQSWTHYLALAGLAIAVFLATFFFRFDSLVLDMREILFYDVVLQFLGLALHFAGATNSIYISLAYSIILLKFGRIFWVAPHSIAKNEYAWFPNGIMAHFHKMEAQSIHAPWSVHFLFFCLAIGFLIGYMGWKVHNSYFMAFALVASLILYNPILNEIQKQDDLRIKAERERAAQEARAKQAEEDACLERTLKEQIRAQNLQLERINASLRDVAHDLRAPLSLIQHAVHQVRLAKTQAEQSHAIMRLEKSVVDFGNSLDDTISDAMLATGISKPEIEAVQLDRLFLRLHREWCNTLFDSGMSAFNLYPRNGSPVMVATDERLLYRLLRNLIHNAIVHARPDAGLGLSLRSVHGACIVRIWDTGQGIADANEQDGAANFQRLLQRRQPNYGHGLGLQIVAQLAMVLGVTVELRSRIGKGTIFRIKLPLADRALLEQRRSVQEL